MRVGGALLALGGLILAASSSGRVLLRAPAEVTHTIAFHQLGLQVVLPTAWTVDFGESGEGFIASHAGTGARLVAATMSNPAAPGLDATIDRIIEEQRARAGSPQSISRGVMSVGLLDARWLKLSSLQGGELVRMRTVAVQRGQSLLTLTCTGGAAAEKACDAAVRVVAVTP